MQVNYNGSQMKNYLKIQSKVIYTKLKIIKIKP